MVCESCGEKPKNTAKDFTKAVIEINNPEALVLLRKVVIPASMGDEESVPPAIGKYRNVLLQYEANDHIYLYSSDGIPTAITANIPQEILDSIAELEATDVVLQQEIDDLKNSPDVVDIVPTYADLQAYDTSKLGDNDIIRVLQDEQHDGQSTYYRWNATTSSWTYIGAVGDYYTKGQVDTLLTGKQNTLTAGTNVQISAQNVISATDTTYSAFVGTDGQTAGTAGLVPAPATTDAGKFLKADGTWDTAGGGGPTVVQTTGTSTTDVMSQNATTSMVFANPGTNTQIRIGSTGNVSNYAIRIGSSGTASNTSAISIGSNAQATGVNAVALGADTLVTHRGSIALGSAAQTTVKGQVMVGTTNTYDGYNSTNYRIISGVHDPVDAHDAATKGYVDAHSGGVTPVQTTGTSTTDVMSQDATTKMIYPRIADYPDSINIRGTSGIDTATGEFAIAVGTSTTARGERAVSIGCSATALANGDRSVAIGNFAKVNNNSKGIAIGNLATCSNPYSIALGSSATTSRVGEVNIGAGTSGEGYNSTNYRVIGGVHDGQDAHDAATVGQLTAYSVVSGAGAPTTSTVAQYVGQFYYDTTNDGYYYCTAITAQGTTPETYSYTWTALSTGGSGPTVVQTTGTSQADVMSQNAVTSMVYADPATKYNVRIGGYATGNPANGGAVILGDASGNFQNSIAVGNSATTYGVGAIALGAGSRANAVGEMNIGSVWTSFGYNSSNYRLLSGLYDAQSDHDAVNLSQLNGRVLQNAGAPTTATVGTVGQLLEDTTNGKLYICADATNPYVWEEVGAGGGGTTEIEYVNCTLTGATATGFTLSADKTATQVKALVESGKEVIYKFVNSVSAGSVLAGTYEFSVLYAGTNTSVDVVTGYGMTSTYGSQTQDVYTFIHTSSAVTVTAGTIPTVNDATLTIQKNGTTVQTFTANASSNATANIEVPVITMQTTDPGEGVPLAANNFIGVYQ